MSTVIFSLIFALAASAAASKPTPKGYFIWKNADGSPAPETESRKSKNGFGGMLVITVDEDYQKKWETPAETTPVFKALDGPVAKGKKIFILPFFSGYLLDKNGKADVRCDIKLTRPGGEASVLASDAPCAPDRPIPNASYILMGTRQLGFVGDPPDPVGQWLVEVSLFDKLRNVRLDLKSSFELK